MFLFWLIPSGYSSHGFLSLKLRFVGQQSLHASRAKGLDSPVCYIWASPVALFFELWILILRIVFWLATPYYQSSHGHRRRYCIQPWASVPRLFLIHGQQRLNFSSGITLSSLKSNSILTLTLNVQILVAIYQFGCRMSNTKVSPQLATLDGPVFVSSALCRENFHTEVLH
jgi:hypothetical protein